jgi:hypothetical protein
VPVFGKFIEQHGVPGFDDYVVTHVFFLFNPISLWKTAGSTLDAAPQQ